MSVSNAGGSGLTGAKYRSLVRSTNAPGAGGALTITTTGSPATGTLTYQGRVYDTYTWSSGTGTVSASRNVTAQVLVVAGGGSGGSYIAGGGGGGGVIAGIYTLGTVSETVVIGAGGASVTASPGNSLAGNIGSDSQFGPFLAKGGGGGGCRTYPTRAALAGGSGGGGTQGSTPGGLASYGSQGFAGGAGSATYGGAGAGGGGYGAVGNTPLSFTTGATGGAGKAWAVNGTVYAGGGGGCYYTTGTVIAGPSGGSGGGGTGACAFDTPSIGETVATAGTNGLGGGGGGSSCVNGYTASGKGGDGLVILAIARGD